MSGLHYQLTVPKNTPVTNPAISDITLIAGNVTAISVGFHNGCNSLVHVIIYDGLKQVLPAVEGQTLAWNAYIFKFPYQLTVPELGHKLRLSGYSPGTLYDHNIDFWFDMVTADELKQEPTLRDLFGFTPDNSFVD